MGQQRIAFLLRLNPCIEQVRTVWYSTICLDLFNNKRMDTGEQRGPLQT